MKKPFVTLLYYKFAPIKNPQLFVSAHRAFCEGNDIKGRILVSEEGLNGTCAGLPRQMEKYKEFVRSYEQFEDIWFKEHRTRENPFRHTYVRYKPEAVALEAGDVDVSVGAEHVSPEAFHQLVQQAQTDDDVVVIDMRSEIEAEVGKFKGAIVPPIRFFRELPEKLDQFADLKDKKVAMYCTGGIRCEKASALMRKHGFKHMYQLDGGIYNYLDKYPNGMFEGSCFVFDDRMQVVYTEDDILTGEEIPEEKVISKCAYCGVKSNRIVNDEKVKGRKLVICCASCDQKHDVSRVR